jgi:hypothetical protein
LLAAQVTIKLVAELPNCTVSAHDGSVYVNVTGDIAQEAELVDEVKKLSEGTPGLKEIKVSVSLHGM